MLRVAICYRIANIIPALPCTLRPDLDIVASQARAESTLSHEHSTTLSVIYATTHATPHPQELVACMTSVARGTDLPLDTLLSSILQDAANMPTVDTMLSSSLSLHPPAS